MLTKGKRLLNAVKKIYKTITSNDSKSNDLTTVVEGIADNYTGEGGGGTTVVANPTLEGTEANLTGLQVGDTKFAVPQGSGSTPHLYQYYAEIQFGESVTNPSRITILFLSSLQLATPEEPYIYDLNIEDLIPLMYVGAQVKCGEMTEFSEITETPGFVHSVSSDSFDCHIYNGSEGSIIYEAIDKYSDIESIRLTFSKQFF